MLSDKAIKEFKETYKRNFGVDLTDDEALTMAGQLMTIFNFVYRPIRKEWEQ